MIFFFFFTNYILSTDLKKIKTGELNMTKSKKLFFSMRATICKSELQFETELQQSCHLVPIYSFVTFSIISTGDFTFTRTHPLPASF